ncbi:MAG: TetR/AcrR family transcriptional regulator [Thermoleophilaceae bacterium]|nr:TetR/AcrR family transcriptional regulator [Thermoleophilaceae bacterium]
MRSQRERMLRGVASAVAEKGYASMTVADIIVRAGVSRKTFYEHFADREECFVTAYDEALSLLLAAVTEAYEQPGEWPSRVRAAIGAFLEYLSREPEFARMCIVEAMSAGDAVLDRREAALRNFALLLDAGRSFGPRELPALTADTVIGGIYNVVYTYVRRGQTKRLPKLLPQLTYIALLPYIGHEQAAQELD